MSGKEGARIFVGGLSWETTERELGAAFSRFGKVLDSQIMVERDTGRPRGFGFVTFADRRAMEDAISEMHNKELDGRQISVNKAEPKVGSDDSGYGHGGGGGGYSSGGRGGYRVDVDDSRPVSQSECFKCGRSGHWARECPTGGGGGGRFYSRSRTGRGGGGGSDRFGGGDRYSDRYMDDRYDGGRYGDRSRPEGRDGRYNSGRDRYASDHYTSVGDRFSGSRYGSGSDRALHDGYSKEHDGYSKERSFERDVGPRSGGVDRYGSGGTTRYESGGAGYRERPGPYDRPSKVARPSYDDRY